MVIQYQVKKTNLIQAKMSFSVFVNTEYNKLIIYKCSFKSNLTGVGCIQTSRYVPSLYLIKVEKSLKEIIDVFLLYLIVFTVTIPYPEPIHCNGLNGQQT